MTKRNIAGAALLATPPLVLSAGAIWLTGWSGVIALAIIIAVFWLMWIGATWLSDCR